jgi:hypothetical protein
MMKLFTIFRSSFKPHLVKASLEASYLEFLAPVPLRIILLSAMFAGLLLEN